MEWVRDQLPEAARDIRLNLGTVFNSQNLNERQVHGTLVACAFAARNAELLAAAEEEVQGKLSDEDVALAKSIAATMGMNNVYYRFLHLVEDPEYAQIPARLRMQALGAPADDKLDRELWALAVSAVNGCGQCIQAHEKTVLQHGASKAMVHDAVRIASVVNAAAAALDAEPSGANVG
jgi:alkyl hydroperoxide reductase subunit D